MPAIYHHGIKAFPRDDVFDLRRIESAEAGDAGLPRNILKKSIGIAFEKRNVPIKLHSKSRVGLLFCCRIVAIENVEAESGLRSQPAKPRAVILNGMSANNRQSFSIHVFATIPVLTSAPLNKRYAGNAVIGQLSVTR